MSLRSLNSIFLILACILGLVAPIDQVQAAPAQNSNLNRLTDSFSDNQGISSSSNVTVANGVSLNSSRYDLALWANGATYGAFGCNSEFFSGSGACPNAWDGLDSTTWITFLVQTGIGSPAFQYIANQLASPTTPFDRIELDWRDTGQGVDYDLFYCAKTNCAGRDEDFTLLEHVTGNGELKRVHRFPPMTAAHILLRVYKAYNGGRVRLASMRVIAAATAGSVTSKVIDAQTPVSWKELKAEHSATAPDTEFRFYTRSGNVAEVDDTWSPWQESLSSSIRSPSARYLQYRADFPSSEADQDLTLSSVSISYVPNKPFSALLGSSKKTLTVADYAGTGVSGVADGPAKSASFNQPLRLAIDHHGNLYVSDAMTNTIRKIAPSGLVSTLDDQNGATLTFNRPTGLVFDSDDNLYVADTDSHQIKKRRPDGTVAVFAGSGTAGSQPGFGIDAQLNGPTDLAIDKENNLYVVNYNTSIIDKISPKGEVSFLAGSVPGYKDGLGLAAQLYHPSGLVVDKNGTIYLADRHNNRIRKITATGAVSTLAGSGRAGANDGLGTNARFNSPSAVVFDANGDLIVLDTGNGAIRKISLAGKVTTIFSSKSELSEATGEVFDAAGNLYIADQLNHRLKVIKADGSAVVNDVSVGFIERIATTLSWSVKSLVGWLTR